MKLQYKADHAEKLVGGRDDFRQARSGMVSRAQGGGGGEGGLGDSVR